ncbi:DUF1569 domain-containing protein [Gemmatimonas sp.]|jgi:hypothetical protein|uniref:DUF1569 domain-containing protein n=1 Tax=Gemmatimonas sp. TaxID=1962908 RepID=UPI0037C116AE
MTAKVYPDLFDASQVDAAIARLHALTPEATPQWGRMVVSEMLAHVNVAYEMVYEQKHPRPNPIMRFVLKRIVKARVVGPDPYPRNTPTAPAFRIKETRDFTVERDRLIAYLQRVQREGRSQFEGRESLSFGPLTATEWNGLFSKHLDHHLEQFGV